MARALIVGCGCRGRALGGRLAAEGWSLRGTTRDPEHVADIEAAGIEAAVADAQRPGTLLDLVGDVTVVHWLLATAQAEPEVIAAIHGARLGALLERLVDTPVRGFVYEAAGTADAALREQGAQIVRDASETWRIRVEVVNADPASADEWLGAMKEAVERTLSV